VQRLFSTFPDGWPGAGLLFLRAVAVIPAVQHGIAGIVTAPMPALAAHFVAACASALLLVGLWTPVAGVAMAMAEVVLAFRGFRDPWIHILLAALGVSLAMLGPGAWSVDSRLFGRKRIHIPQR